MVIVNTDLKNYKRAMDLFDKTTYPRVLVQTLNHIADDVTQGAKKNVSQRLIVRTKFTTNSIRTDRRARGTNLRTMHSRSVTISPYLGTQEEGGNIPAKSSVHAIPTIKSRSSRNIRKSIARRYRLNNLPDFSTSKQFFMARPRGKGSRPPGIWERYQNNKKIRLIRRTEDSSITLKAKHWHRDSVRVFASPRNVTKLFQYYAKRGFDK